MYAQADLDGNDIFLMDFMVDYKCNEHSLTIKYHNIVVKGGPSLLRCTV